MFRLSKHVYAFSSVWVNYERVIRNLFYEEERKKGGGGGEENLLKLYYRHY